MVICDAVAWCNIHLTLMWDSLAVHSDLIGEVEQAFCVWLVSNLAYAWSVSNEIH